MGKSRGVESMIQFSYTKENGIHVFGRKRIPEDISKEEAEKMVEDQKAKYVEVEDAEN